MKIKKITTSTIFIFLSLIIFSFNVNAYESPFQITKANIDDILIYENQNNFISLESNVSEIGVSISGYIYESYSLLYTNGENHSFSPPISDVSVSIKLLNSQSYKVNQVIDPIIHNTTVSYGSTFSSWNIASSNSNNLKEKKYIFDSPNYEVKLVNDSNMALVSSEIQIPIWRYTLTDNNGYFNFDSLKTGTYEIYISKSGYKSESKKITVDEDVILDFSLQKNISDYDLEIITNYPINESLLSIREIGGRDNLKSINTAIKNGEVGGEIFIEKSLDGKIFLQNEDITIKSLGIDDNKLSILVSGEDSTTGKTIVINTESGYFKNTDNIIINYDGELIKIADDINDILNPSDDSSRAEYLILQGADGVQILVSIPHFSDHQITIYSVSEIVETLGGTTAIMIYIIVCLVTTTIFVGTIHLRRRI